MPTDVPAQVSLPDDLQARLAAAGVTDDANLAAALQRDPALAADLQAFVEANADAMAGDGMAALIAAFAAVEDGEQMMAFWRSVPAELEEPLMEAVEALIAHAEQAGDAAAVEHLRPRLEGFRQIHQAAELPPVMRAVLAFVQAPDDAAAEALFKQEKTLLQPYEAQEALDMLAAQAPPDAPVEVRERLAARSSLLHRLRGAAPRTPQRTETTNGEGRASTFDNRSAQVSGDLYQAGRDQHFFSAHAESGGVATVVNNFFARNLPQEWKGPPSLAVDRRHLVTRSQEMDKVRAALTQEGSVAITGQSSFVAVQGMAGVGKTVLAQMLALEMGDRYPDGVIWEELGPDFTSPEQAQSRLGKWASYATGFFGLKENENRIFRFEPDGVRYLLFEHPRLLVVLDNVWSLAAIQPLRQALPPGAHLLITTRSQEIARGLGGGRVEVGRLSEGEALDLFELRLGWRPRPEEREGADAWAFALMAGIDRHALGLDVALGVLEREGGQDRTAWRAAARRLLQAIREGDLGDLTQADDVSRNVQVVLLYSVRALDQESQHRFRWLGACAAEAPFATPEAAALWGCDEESARRTLVAFVNAALLERVTEQTGEEQAANRGWRQHSLLRGVALDLLRQAGEQDQAAAAHARAYGDAMAAADDQQRYHEMLPAMPQLRHAFEWAIANDLELALGIAANCANLQKQFGLTREGGQWAERLLEAALAGRASPATLARVHGHRATILSELATLPGEDRRQRLYDALAAYDDALRFRRPDNAPLAYATTQNNRATILSALATLPGEDRRQRLYDALAAYDDALRFRRPDNAPLAYAMTQGNLANLYAALAELPEEDRRARQRQSVEAVALALTFFERVGHAVYVAQAQRQTLGLRSRFGDAVFDALWNELGLGAMPAWLREEAGSAPDPAMQALLNAFVQVQNAEQMIALWQAVPSEMEEPLIEAIEALIAQAEQAGDQGAVAHLRSRLEGFREIRAAASAAHAIPEEQQRDMAALAERAQAYVEKLQAANSERPQVAEWQEITTLGEALLAEEGRNWQGVDWAALRRQLASDYNTLGNAHDSAGDAAAALAAFERAIALQPDFAMWRRNQAGTLIELGRLDEAAAASEAARHLEPDAPRLAQLEAQLAAAREDAGG